ncbi:hypothetical protein [Alicyclobacillus sp. SP_1]|jgi:hypothetical protein|nr:hypothetical protein [Alicyclobacillus sp. SP_1]
MSPGEIWNATLPYLQGLAPFLGVIAVLRIALMLRDFIVELFEDLR